MNTIEPTSQPLYVQVAHTLQTRIQQGLYPIGSLLPTEIELAGSFGVSRQTVRQAIGHLRQLRLLSARKGIGTRVEASQPERAYYQALQSLADLFQFASDFVYRVTEVTPVPVAGKLAADLGCRPGRIWIRLSGLRETTTEGAPLCRTIVYVNQRYADAVAAARTHNTAIFSLIENRYGVSIAEVRQDIEAVLLDAEAAALLQAPVASPALLITRRYFDAGRQLIELSTNLHPADRFRYAMTLRRQEG